MRFVQHNGLQFLQFPHMMKCPGIWHGIPVAWTSSNRHAPRRFNLGLGCGMSDAAVWQNRHRLLSTIHPDARGVFTRQVHGSTAVVWHEETPGDQTIAGIVEGDALITAGVRANNIDVSGVCTKCNPHLFFSYRHQKQTGRFSSVVGVIPDKAQP